MFPTPRIAELRKAVDRPSPGLPAFHRMFGTDSVRHHSAGQSYTFTFKNWLISVVLWNVLGQLDFGALISALNKRCLVPLKMEFGLGIAAHVRMRAMPGEVKRVAQMLIDTPEVVEADRVTREDCFLAKVMVSDVQELESVIDRFQPYASADRSIILSSTVVPRLPKI